MEILKDFAGNSLGTTLTLYVIWQCVSFIAKGVVDISGMYQKIDPNYLLIAYR